MTETGRREAPDRRRFALAMLAILVLAGGLRMAFQPADPPWHATVGIVWHDEGGWVHNARNRALFGTWRLDEWNPMFVSPVSTGLEYLAFSAFGVGFRQARLMPEWAGVLSVLLLGLALARMYGRTAGLIAALLLATNYAWVMYTRVALLEAPMVTLAVAAFYAYTRAERRAGWAIWAAILAVTAFMAKASAVFVLVSLGVCGLIDLFSGDPADRRRGWFLMCGLAGATVAAILLFIWPNWEQYSYYNLQLYGARRSALALRPLLDRASWFPIIHDFFTRMWLITLLAAAGVVTLFARARSLRAPERLLLLWIAVGSAELILHDLGNERRFVFLIPALIAAATFVVVRERRLLGEELAAVPRKLVLFVSPIVFFLFYVLGGAVLRLVAIYQVRPGVRLSAGAAVALTVYTVWTWPALARLLSRSRMGVRVAVALVLLAVAADLAQYVWWARQRTYLNYEASVALGDILRPGTLVQGKLASGLSLENGIKPLFIGPGFGNYADRRVRPDVRYVLTYVAPELGYEGEVIKDVLGASPGWRILRKFPVAETRGGADRAALIEK
jgi:4-amino-4-deoxy-L-arabinose transferase-like glycosyltransferase